MLSSSWIIIEDLNMWENWTLYSFFPEGHFFPLFLFPCFACWALHWYLALVSNPSTLNPFQNIIKESETEKARFKNFISWSFWFFFQSQGVQSHEMSLCLLPRSQHSQLGPGWSLSLFPFVFINPPLLSFSFWALLIFKEIDVSGNHVNESAGIQP